MKNEIIFNSIQDMIEYVTENTYRAKTRWTLWERESREWVDEVAGAAWDAENDALGYVSYSDPGRAEFETKRDELRLRCPEQKRVACYGLMQAGDRYRPTHIKLSSELGSQLKAIWTVRKSRWSETFVPITIPGLLKRLGKTDIGAQVKAAEKKAKETSERNSRNYVRRQARELAQKLLDLQAKHPEMVFPAQLTEIAVMEDEVAND